jgi:hypothetical protein
MVAQIPIELLQIIFQDATPESLRTYRLVDRQWCAASTPYVFARFHTSLFSRSLNKLSALAQSPLAKHVKAIDFHSDQLPNYTRQEWESKIDRRPNISTFRNDLDEQADWSQTTRRYKQLPRHNYTPAQLEAGWSAFQKYCIEQKRWIDGQAGLILKDCLARLHNLSEVVISRAKPFSGRVNDMPFWRNVMGEILVGPDAWTYESVMDNRHEALSALFMITAIGHRTAVTGIKAVEKLTLDLPEMFSFYHLVHLPPSSKSVIPEEYHERGFTGADADKAHLSARYQVILDAFRPLKHLVIRCPSVRGDDLADTGAVSQARESEQFLAAAVNLRILDLDFGEPGSSYEGVDEESNPFDVGFLLLASSDHEPYRYLEDLRISAAFPSELFNNFLIRHKETLKRLDIRDSLSDRWDKILKTIAKDLNLDHIYVESLWLLTSEDDSDDEEGPGLLLGEGLDAEDEFTREMKAFLQTGEGSMPRIAEFEMMDFDDVEDDEML